jgi:DNA polymerase-3 subunit gamma/tau
VPTLGLTGLGRELAVNCELQILEENSVQLRLAPEHQALAGERGKQKLQQALNDYYGKTMRLNIVIAELKSESPAAIGQRQDHQRQVQAIKSIEADPAVLEIIETFDAHIDTQSIRPID